MPPFHLPAAELDALAALVRSLNGPAAEGMVSRDPAAGEHRFLGEDTARPLLHGPWQRTASRTGFVGTSEAK